MKKIKGIRRLNEKGLNGDEGVMGAGSSAEEKIGQGRRRRGRVGCSGSRERHVTLSKEEVGQGKRRGSYGPAVPSGPRVKAREREKKSNWAG